MSSVCLNLHGIVCVRLVLAEKMGATSVTGVSLVTLLYAMGCNTAAVPASRAALASCETRQMAADCTGLVQCLRDKSYSACAVQFSGCRLHQLQLQAAAKKIAELEKRDDIYSRAFLFWCHPKECTYGKT